MQNGLLTGCVIDRGEISINEAGMDGSVQHYTDIVADRNQVDAAHQICKLQQSDDSLKPQLALDVSSLGGMYAGLMGTECGVGVHNAGEIGASAGNVTLSADGSIANSGTIYAKDHLAIESQIQLSNSEALSDVGNLNASVTGITNITDSSLTAGL